MFTSGLVIIASLVCGTIMVLNGVSAWLVAWPMILSVYFAFLTTALLGVESKKSKPWPKREE